MGARQISAMKYMHERNTSGHVGVCYKPQDRNRPWVVRINRDKTTYCVGSFASKEQAISAYEAKNKELREKKSNDCIALLPDGTKEIPGFSGYYADLDGNIWSTAHSKPRILHGTDCRGYFLVSVRGSNGRAYCKPIHKLVILAYAGLAPTKDMVCRHLDGDSHNNKPNNLKWGTHEENCADRTKHGRRWGHTKLTEEQVLEIKALKGVVSRNRLAAMYKVGSSTISSILEGKSWQYLERENVTAPRLVNVDQYRTRAESAALLRRLADEIEAGPQTEKCWVIAHVLTLPADILDRITNIRGRQHQEEVARQLTLLEEQAVPHVRRVMNGEKLRAAQVLEICAKKGKLTSEQLGRDYGVTKTMIRRIWSGGAWSHVTGLVPRKDRERLEP